MAIIEVPDSGATAPNDITEKDGVTASVPVDLTEKAATTPDAPNTLTETADTGASTPNDITEKASNNATAPNDLTEKAAASASLPNDLTEVADTGAAIPVNLTEVSSSDALAPNDLTEKAAVTPDAPNDLTETVSSGAAAPSTITSVAACPFPRTLTPLVSMDFANNAYAQNQTSVAFDDLFTYTRNSSATFWNRRLDRSGKWQTFLDTDVVGDVENLFTYSESFTNWTAVGLSVVENATTNPVDGLKTADQLVETSGMTHQIDSNSVSFTSGLKYTASFYIKKTDNNRNAYISLPAAAFASDTIIVVDTATGVLLDIDAGVDYATSVYEGENWFRFSLTATCTATASGVAKLYLTEGEDLLYSGDDISGIYVFGGQVTQSAKALPYVKSISSATTEVFAESRLLEYDPVSALPVGVAIWQSSTNLFLNSEDLSSWSNSNSTIESNVTTAPDLTTSMDKITANSTGTMCPSIYQAITSVASDQYTVSFFVKSAEVQFAQIWFSSSHVSGDPRVNFGLINNEIGTQDANIENATIKDVGNGISRITCTVTAAGTALTAWSSCVGSLTDTRGEQNAWTVGDGFYAWGGQCEEGAIATLYIMTEGSAVTRAADDLSLSSSGNFNANEYTLSIVATYFDNESHCSVFSISDNTNANRTQIRITNQSANGAVSLSDSVTQFSNVGATITIGNEASQIITFSDNSAFFYLNKVIDGTDVDCLPIADHSIIHLGRKYSATELLNGNIKSVAIYEEAMTAQEVGLL